jgi:hypothetical protein
MAVGACDPEAVDESELPTQLAEDRTDELALIDWGTPSWGPLLYDLAGNCSPKTSSQ